MQWTKTLALALGLGLAGLAGCDDKFLTTVPTDQLSDAVFWKQEKDAVLAVNAVYPMLSGWDYLYFDAASDKPYRHPHFYKVPRGVKGL